MTSRNAPSKITGIIAVAMLPVALLVGIGSGLTQMVAVFIIGWLLLTPVSAILFGNPNRHDSDSREFDDEIEALVRERVKAGIRGDDGTDGRPTTDPIEQLRGRYARGEIDDAELEHRLDALLEMEDADPDDEAAIERVRATLDAERERATSSR